MRRSEISGHARTYLGARWAHTGRTSTGMDCIGLVILTGQHFGMQIVDMTGYGRQPQGERFVNHLKDYLVVATPQVLKEGQIAVFNDSNFPCHCGIIGRKGAQFTLIHSSIFRRGVVEEFWSKEWQSKVRLLLEMPEVTD